MIYLKCFEDHSTYDFDTKRNDDEFKIIAKHKGSLAGSTTFRKLFSDGGWYWFEGLLTHDQYDDLFEDKPFVILEHIRVYGDNRKSGLGTKLMTMALDMINKLGIKLIVLNASPLGEIPLDKLVNFYEKFGFKIFKNQGKNVIMIKRT